MTGAVVVGAAAVVATSAGMLADGPPAPTWIATVGTWKVKNAMAPTAVRVATLANKSVRIRVVRMPYLTRPTAGSFHCNAATTGLEGMAALPRCTWLYRIVYNACIDDLRSRKATVSLDERIDTADVRPRRPRHEAVVLRHHRCGR